MPEGSENREVRVEMLAGGRPRVLLDGKDITEQTVDAGGGVRLEQPGISLRILAGSGDEGSPPPLPVMAEAPPRTVGVAPGGPSDDDAQTATVIQTQTVSVSASGSVTIFLTQNAQVSQNQANLTCKKKRHRCC